MVVRDISRGGVNRSICAKEGWEKVVLPSILYGMEVIPVTKSWLRAIERKQLKMARFILGTSRGANGNGWRGVLGWHRMEVRVDTAFAAFVRRFEWAKSEWGKAVWELEKGNVSNSRTKRVRCLEEKYEIDMERESVGLHIWRSYVKKKIEERAVRKWVEEGKGQSSLRFFVQSEEDFGKCSTMNSSWDSKYLTRIQIGDMYQLCGGK